MARFVPAAERVEQRKETASLLKVALAWADATVNKMSAKSAPVEAFRYILKRHGALSCFVTDGRLKAHTNIAENSMRKIALSRRNYPFAGSARGSQRAESPYTFVITTQLKRLNPQAYLKDTLTPTANGHPINRINELIRRWRASATAAQTA